MIYKGHNLRYNRSLTFRDAVDGDVYAGGSPVSAYNCMFVKKKDCPVLDSGYIDPKGVKAIPLQYHSRTNMAYSAWKETNHREPQWFIVNGDYRNSCYSRKRQIFVAYDGVVYSTSQYQIKLEGEWEWAKREY